MRRRRGLGLDLENHAVERSRDAPAHARREKGCVQSPTPRKCSRESLQSLVSVREREREKCLSFTDANTRSFAGAGDGRPGRGPSASATCARNSRSGRIQRSASTRRPVANRARSSCPDRETTNKPSAKQNETPSTRSSTGARADLPRSTYRSKASRGGLWAKRKHLRHGLPRERPRATASARSPKGKAREREETIPYPQIPSRAYSPLRGGTRV